MALCISHTGGIMLVNVQGDYLRFLALGGEFSFPFIKPVSFCGYQKLLRSVYISRRN